MPEHPFVCTRLRYRWLGLLGEVAESLFALWPARRGAGGCLS